tara:strand:+ start:176 stop:448 length:273 start_codon:yes stop_codon:yes gene_type:complete
MTRHKGYANSATWRVKTDVFKDFNLDDWCLDMLDSVELAGWMRDHTREIIEEAAQPGLARDYAIAFLADVDWAELAQTAWAEYWQEELDV